MQWVRVVLRQVTSGEEHMTRRASLADGNLRRDSYEPLDGDALPWIAPVVGFAEVIVARHIAEITGGFIEPSLPHEPPPARPHVGLARRCAVATSDGVDDGNSDAGRFNGSLHWAGVVILWSVM